MTNTAQQQIEDSPEAVEAAAEALFRTDTEMMGPLANLFGEDPTWESAPEMLREAYRGQVRTVLSAFLTVTEESRG